MTQATDDVYYLYVGNGWSGPFRVDQIRLFVKEKQIAADTYAFEPQQQMQLTVAQLLVDSSEADTGSYQNPTAPPATGITRSPNAAPDPQDLRRTMMVPAQGGAATTTAGSSSAAATGSTGSTGASGRRIAETRQTQIRSTRAQRDDSDIIDLDRVASSVGPAKAPADDSDVIDLDAMDAKTEARTKVAAQASGDLSIEIDEPRGRPAESTIHTRASATEALEVVLGELENLRKAYNSLMENSIKDREEAQQKVHVSHIAINEVLEERKADIAEIRSLVAEIEQDATDLAKRSRDSTLSTRIIRLRDSLQESDVAQMVQGAEAVLRRIVEQSDRQSQRLTVDASDPFSSFDAGHSGQHPPAGEQELAALQESYDRLRERLHHEQEAAKERLLNATMLLESERTMRSQDQGELRTMVTEVYRLACEIDPKWMSKELYGRVQQLWGLLAVPDQGTPPAQMAPVADEIIQGLVHTLKDRALSAPSLASDAAQEIGTQRRLAAERAHELSSLRADLLQTRTDLSLLKQREQALEEEKNRLTKLLDEQKAVAEKSQLAAKAREQRLRSTVTALEVTKELHQEVMRDLQTQLAAAEGRVESMELELRDVRGQLTARRERRDSGDDLQAEMRRVLEMRAMLDARKQELSADLQSTQAELERVAGSGEADHDLAEALAGKVNHLRQTYEQTLARLNDQEAKAESLTASLEESRREAGQLRTRSDDLNSELTEARGNLSAAKKRVDELHQAYARLESERESLQNELTARRSTTTIFHQDSDGVMPPPLETHEHELANRLEAEERLRSAAETDLARERRQAEDLMAQAHALHSRVTELTLDRDHLKAEQDRLRETQAQDIARLNAALSTSTQSAIEAESRQRQAEARIAALEAELASSPAGESVRTPTPTGVRLERSTAAELSHLRTDRDRLTAELAQARTEQQNAIALLAQAKAAVEQATRESAQSRTQDIAAARAEAQQRLGEAERDIQTAAAQRDQVRSRLAAAEAEIDRLHREQESAAAEHRAALQSARNRLGEEQLRAEELSRELADLRGHVQGLTARGDALQQQYDLLRAETQGERSVTATELNRLAGVAQELEEARTRISELTKELSAHQITSNEVATRLPELESRLQRSQAERAQLLAELDRLRSEVVTLTQRHVGEDQAEALQAQLERLASAKGESELQLSSAQGLLANAQATVQKLTAQVAELSAGARTAADAHAGLESRHTIAAKRLAAADQLLAQARVQQRSTTTALDQAQLAIARLEAERTELADEAMRLRAAINEPDQRVREGSIMPELQEQQVHELERQLQEANARLRELEGRGKAPQTDRLRQELARSRAETAAVQERLLRLEAAASNAPTLANRVLPEPPTPSAATPRLAQAAPSLSSMIASDGLKDAREAGAHGVVDDQPASAQEIEELRHAAARIGRGAAPAATQALAASAPASPSGRQTRFTAAHGRTFGPSLGDAPGLSTRFGQGRTTSAFKPGPNAHAPTTRARSLQGFSEQGPAAEAAPATLPTARAATDAPLPTVFRMAERSSASTGATVLTRQTWRTVSPPTETAWSRYTLRWQALGLRSRLLLGIAGGGVLLISGVWALAMGLPTTQTAVVNADVAVIKAPIDGVVQELPVTTGSTIHQGATVVRIHNDLVDDTHLRELTVDLRDARAVKDTAATALADAKRVLAGRITDRAAARAAALAVTQHGVAAAVQAEADAQEMVKLRQLVLTTLQALVAAGRLQDADLQSSRALAAAADADLIAARAARTQAETHAAAAQVDDAKAQAEIDQAQAQVDLAQSVLTTDLAAIDSGVAAVSAEQAHLAALRDATLASPLSGPVWVQKATAGAQVQAGAPVLEIADPTTIAIEAVFEPSAASQVHVGDLVRVRLPASGVVMDGHIRSFAQEGDIGMARAEDLGPQAPEALRATIDLDGAPAKTQLLGQGCEVVVVGNHSLLGSCVGWLYYRMKF